MSGLPKLLTARQVAETTGLPRWRIYELANAGEIPHLRIGRTLRFSEAALVKWIESGGSSQGE